MGAKAPAGKGVGTGQEDPIQSFPTWEACERVVKKERADFFEFIVRSPLLLCPRRASLTRKRGAALQPLLRVDIPLPPRSSTSQTRRPTVRSPGRPDWHAHILCGRHTGGIDEDAAWLEQVEV